MSASCIYEGAVRHRRFAVRGHAFRYRLALAYLDLDELPRLLNGRLVGHNRGLVRFRRRDYLPGSDRPLADAVRDLVHQRTGRRPAGPIRLLTQLCSFGHCFNPVSFYYCFDRTGERLEHVLAEVTNTPWGERHTYLLSATEPGDALIGSSAKQLHVSPFMAMEHRYDWRVVAPDTRLVVHIESHRRGSLAFDATLCLRRRELTRAALARITARYPFATLRVLALIYMQALRLKIKGVPVHPHARAHAEAA
ncbi:MAG TPA: DUF1365 domain-containing protein [Solirubrobacteraceae bacterium]|nr:DUF1365 domain-containing protein [Solirubrobacteraceae bacterium]